MNLIDQYASFPKLEILDNLLCILYIILPISNVNMLPSFIT